MGTTETTYPINVNDTDKFVSSHTANTTGYLTCATASSTNVDDWDEIEDGSFRITIDGTAYNVDGLDIKAESPGDMDAVATYLQAQLRAVTSSTETLVWSTDHFVITSATSSEDSEVKDMTTSTGTVGTDLSGEASPTWMNGSAGTETAGTSDHDKIPLLGSSGKMNDGLISNDIRNIKTLTAGETINGATLPVAVYQDTSDGEIYACDANDSGTLEFIGFAITTANDTESITVQTNGIVSGFSGLTPGDKYYVQDDKTLGTSWGTYEVPVGIAISATEILIILERPARFYTTIQNDQTWSASGGTDSQDISVTCGFRPRFIELHGMFTNTASLDSYVHGQGSGVALGAVHPMFYDVANDTYKGFSTNGTILDLDGESSTYIWYNTNAGETCTVTITDITDTGFNVHFAKNGVDAMTINYSYIMKVQG